MKYFFIGIGGIGMSALAQLLKFRGNSISGSDLVKTEITQKLEKDGIRVYNFHTKQHISPDIDAVIYSLAISKDNPEIKEAQRLKTPILSRSELLGKLMREYSNRIAIAGTHGKTTTTSLLAVVLEKAGLNPTAVIGAEVASLGSNLRVGGDDYFIAEACEYQKSFLDLNYNYAIVTNIEPDHLDFYSDFDGIVGAFSEFAAKIPKDGILVLYGDNKTILDKISVQSNCKIITYGLKNGNDFRVGEISFGKDGTSFVVSNKESHSNLSGFWSRSARQNDKFRKDLLTCHSGLSRINQKEKLKIKIPGDHNVLNAAACFILANELGVKKSTIKKALFDFKGAKRRFEIKGEIKGVTIVDDYGHHPTEIKATLKAAKEYFKGQRIWAVFQPHQYSRTRFFLSEFAKSFKDADKVVLLDIYASRDSEKDKKSVSIIDLLSLIKDNGKEAYFVGDFKKTTQFLVDNLKEGDIVFTIGAGDVWKVGEALISKIKDQKSK